MTKNLWAITKIYCGNHDTPVEMIFKEGPKSVFYACPEYNKRYHGKTGCPNRFSIEQMEEILNLISKKMAQYRSQGIEMNLTNYKFTHKGLECKIIEYVPGKLSVQVLNKKTFIH